MNLSGLDTLIRKRQEWNILKNIYYETRANDYLYIRLGRDMRREIYKFLFSRGGGLKMYQNVLKRTKTYQNIQIRDIICRFCVKIVAH